VSCRSSARALTLCAGVVAWIVAAPALAADEAPADAPPPGTDTPWYKDWRKSEEPLWAITGFFGEGMDGVFSESLLNAFEVSSNSERVVGITVRRRIGGFTRHITFEAEGMYALHYGTQRYQEFGIAAYARWGTFPWNEYVITSVAFGVGPSYTDTTPELEKREHGKNDVRTLNQFNFELTGALPKYPNVQALARLQHRSGIGGLINGVEDASNFWTFGLIYRF